MVFLNGKGWTNIYVFCYLLRFLNTSYFIFKVATSYIYSQLIEFTGEVMILNFARLFVVAIDILQPISGKWAMAVIKTYRLTESIKPHR